jgi:hypothetical protein
VLLQFLIKQIKKLINPESEQKQAQIAATEADQETNATIKTIKKWWRPSLYIILASLIILHGFVLPLSRGDPVDLSGLSLLITAVLGIF